MVQRWVEWEPRHFLIRTALCTLSRPSHIKILVLHFLFTNVFFLSIQTFFKNPARLGPLETETLKSTQSIVKRRLDQK